MRRRRRFRIPNISSRPTRLGTGTATLYVSKRYVVDTSTLTVKSMGVYEILNGSSEFALMKNEYMYFKILYVAAIILPRNMINTTTQTYIFLNWANDHDYTAEQIIHSDTTKIVPPVLTRSKICKFLPPNILVNTQTPTNPSEFHTTASINNYPGWFKIYTGNLPTTIRFEIKVKFRGIQEFQINQLISDLKKVQLEMPNALNERNMGEVQEENEESEEEKIEEIKEDIKRNNEELKENSEEFIEKFNKKYKEDIKEDIKEHKEINKEIKKNHKKEYKEPVEENNELIGGVRDVNKTIGFYKGPKKRPKENYKETLKENNEEN